MPELPEVETVRRQLEPEVVGRTIEEAEILDQRWTLPDGTGEVAARLEGRRIESVGRRGKYLLVGLDDGATLVMHLRMTGNIVVAEGGIDGERLGAPRLYESPPRSAHLRAALHLSGERTIEFTDARRFGNGTVLGPGELAPYLDQRLGVEPLGGELTPELIGEIAQGRTAPLKSFLLNQKGIAGIGNIYADEALHRARLHPLSPAGSMRAPHWEELRDGIVDALELGIANGGSSIDDYRDVRGERGSMQEEFLVHTREGKSCSRCGEPISRIVVGGRSTYFCGNCQVRLRRRPRRKKIRAR